MSGLWAPLVVAALASAACSDASTPPSGNTSGSSGGTNAGSGSLGSSGGSSGSSAAATGTSSGSSAGASGSGSTGGDSGSSGSSGVPAPSVQGTLTYNTAAVTHPGWIAVLTQPPGPGVPAEQLFPTDPDGQFRFDVEDGGTYYVLAAYAPGSQATLADGGPAYPVLGDGGLAEGFTAQGVLGLYPGQISGANTADVDVSEMKVGVLAVTVNASPFTDAGVPPGGLPLPDGGQLFPVLASVSLSGVDPATGIPVEDLSSALVTPPGSAPLSLANVPADHAYEYLTAITNLTAWKPATDGTYVFSAQGSNVLGLGNTGSLPRRLEVHPIADVPIVASPADGSSHNAATERNLTVAWVDPQGTDRDEVKVIELGGAAETTLCDITEATSPVLVGASIGGPETGCTRGFQLNRSYRIEVTSARIRAQAEGYAYEAAYASVTVSY
jgi:hypothetical protein